MHRNYSKLFQMKASEILAGQLIIIDSLPHLNWIRYHMQVRPIGGALSCLPTSSFSPYSDGLAPREASLLHRRRRIGVSVRRHRLKLAVVGAHRLIGAGPSVGRRPVGLEELVVDEILNPGIRVPT